METKIENSVISAIFERRSIRSYKPEQITAEELQTLLACAVQAPSGKNAQPWLIKVSQNQEFLADLSNYVVNKLRSDPSNGFLNDRPNYNVFHKAPTVFFVAGEKASPWAQIDCGILAENVALAAVSMGLGTCIVGFVAGPLAEEGGKRYLEGLHIPETHRLLFAISIGYPEKLPADRGRNPDKIEFLK